MLRSRDRSTPRASCDQAASEVVGSLMLVAVTVILAATFMVWIFGAQPGPHDQLEVDLNMELGPGADCAWGTGDETVMVKHLGGERLVEARTRVQLTINGETPDSSPIPVDLPQQALEKLGDVFGGPDPEAIDDATFTIGEVWTVGTFQIASDDVVHLNIVEESHGAQLVFSGRARAPSGGCS